MNVSAIPRIVVVVVVAVHVSVRVYVYRVCIIVEGRGSRVEGRGYRLVSAGGCRGQMQCRGHDFFSLAELMARVIGSHRPRRDLLRKS